MRYFAFIFLAAMLILTCYSIKTYSDEGYPLISASPTAIMAMPAASPSPSGTPMVPVAEPAAPPQWAQDLMMTAQSLPVIGPIVSKILFYMGILCSVMTMTVGFLLSLLSMLQKALNVAGIVNAVSKIEAFKKGKIMYWLKFASMFNAQKAPKV